VAVALSISISCGYRLFYRNIPIFVTIAVRSTRVENSEHQNPTRKGIGNNTALRALCKENITFVT
jgi:hypothetical protein